MNEVATSHDDLEQYGRRYCARIEGIRENVGETEDDLFTSIQSALAEVDVPLVRNDLANYHRSAAARVSRDGTRTQQCILSFTHWAPRRRLYGANKRARGLGKPIRCHNDLTRRRFQLLSATRDRLKAAIGESNDVFVYSDVNSNLRMRTPDGVKGFNSTEEAQALINQLD